MAGASTPISLSMDELRALGAWAADRAEGVLSIFETRAPGDTRPRTALEAIRAFAAGQDRGAGLRRAALAALAAAREAGDPAAEAAARAAGLAAATAYTHPLAAAEQTKHIVGPPAYAFLARSHAEGSEAAETEFAAALASAPRAVVEILSRMEPREPGRGTMASLFYRLDRELRALGREK